MKIIIKIVAAISVASFAGCASKTYVKPGATQQDWQHDYNDCLVKANQAGYSGGNFGANINRNKFIDMCVQGRGWSARSKEGLQADAQMQSQKRSELDQIRADYQAKMKSFEDRVKEICANEEYLPLISKSPCAATEITLDQMADGTKLSTGKKKSFLKFRKEAEAVSKEMAEYIRSTIHADSDRQWADYFDSTESIRNGYNLDLYNGKITWGEYNKSRKDLITKIQAEKRKIYQPSH